MTPLSFKRIACGLLVICSAVLLCLADVAAQSGRRTKTSSSVPPPANTQQTPATEESSRMRSIVITGHDIDPDTKEIWSNETSTVAEACSERLKQGKPLGLEIVYGGKMKKTQAAERAKQETNSYVLWFGYRSELVGLDFVIDYIEYVVFMPQTAKILTEGRVHPNQQKTTADPGRIIRLPTRTRRRQSNGVLLEEGGRQIADRVKGVL